MADDIQNGIVQAANLAKLDLSKEDTENLLGQVTRILDYVEVLKTLDIDGVKPTSHVRFMPQPLREDVVIERITKAEGIQNSPAKDEDFFIVPEVL